MNRKITLLIIASTIIFGCTSKYSAKNQDSIKQYTEILCRVKENRVGVFKDNIRFSIDRKTVKIGNKILPCSRDSLDRCHAFSQDNNEYTFYSLMTFVSQNSGSGYADIATIKGNMIKSTNYFEMECNKI
jgi:hypothetical protein